MVDRQARMAEGEGVLVLYHTEHCWQREALAPLWQALARTPPLRPTSAFERECDWHVMVSEHGFRVMHFIGQGWPCSGLRQNPGLHQVLRNHTDGVCHGAIIQSLVWFRSIFL